MLIFWSCINPSSISTEGLNCSVSRSETTQHCLVVHWCEPPAPPHSALALSMKCFKLSDRSSQCGTSLHVRQSLSKTEGAELGAATSITQHKNVAVPTAQGAKLKLLLSPPYSSVLALIAAYHSCLLFPSPSSPICLTNPCSSVQVFRVSCPNPETGCSYLSAASSPERKKFQYFNIRSHPNSGKKPEIRDSL